MDFLLLDNKLRYELALLDREQKLAAEMAPLLPFAPTLFGLVEERRRFVRPAPADAAKRITAMTTAIEAARAAMTTPANRPSKIVALRAAEAAADLRGQFQGWLRFYQGYDAEMTWWVGEPAKRFDTALESWRRYLREQLVGARDGQDEPIVGDPIGAEGLAADLQAEMIAYTPAELIAIAEKEYAYLLGEAKKTARSMGLGDDWKKAAEKTKDDFAPVGTQTLAVRDMALRGHSVRREEQSRDSAAAGEGDLADGDDVAGGAEGLALLPRRRGDPGVVADRRDDRRGEADGAARQQSARVARHRAA